MQPNCTSVIGYVSSSELLTTIFINCGPVILQHVISIFFYNRRSVRCVRHRVFFHFVSFSFLNYRQQVWKKFQVFCILFFLFIYITLPPEGKENVINITKKKKKRSCVVKNLLFFRHVFCGTVYSQAMSDRLLVSPSGQTS